ncbi:hypothetical protein pipiens_010778 [Culex pipiens pipiens]|uniref:Secreted protein n=1 Tax=Culex pipiens pipiens TaxID=38569 RepID=A0ABD1D8U7_CULPP
MARIVTICFLSNGHNLLLHHLPIGPPVSDKTGQQNQPAGRVLLRNRCVIMWTLLEGTCNVYALKDQQPLTTLTGWHHQ